jgi:protein tyrosine phosphatase type 4A
MRYHVFNENLNDSQRNFIISESPNNITITEYINILLKNSINIVICLSEDKKYDVNVFKNVNIDYLHFPIKDGTTPTDEQIKKLLKFLERYNSIAFHCDAGLGRAPLMLAISFILLFNYKPANIIEKIRGKEKRALNTTQLTYLFAFKRNKYIDNGCIIS